MRSFMIAAFALICFVISPISFAQSRDRRLEDAISDIRLLKRVVDEQNRRITELEKTVKELQASAAAAAQGPAEPARIGKPIAPIPWHVPNNWMQVKRGMSRSDVENILGPPTSVDSVIDSQTLVYRDTSSPTGVLQGTIKLVDDRVTAVDPPEF